MYIIFRILFTLAKEMFLNYYTIYNFNYNLEIIFLAFMLAKSSLISN